MSDSVADIVNRMGVLVRDRQLTVKRRPLKAPADLDINLLAARLNAQAKKKGFPDKKENLPEALMLVVSELSEALEELRSLPLDCDRDLELSVVTIGESGKPEGFCVEVIDAIIRLLDIAADCYIDVATVLMLKAAFNETRPHKHGKNF